MKRSRASELSMEITVGAFMFMILLALGFFTIVLSSEKLFQETHQIHVVFDEVQGLKSGDKVLVRGVEFGKVQEMDVEPDGVHIYATVDRPLNFKEDYTIEILSSSVLGGKNVAINEGSREAEPLPPNTQLKGLKPVDLVDEASETIAAIRDALEDGGILENLEQAVLDIRNVAAGLSDGEGTIGKLLQDDTVYNDISEITGNLKLVSAKLSEGEGTLGRLLMDDQVHQDLQAITTNLKEVSERLSSGQGTLGRLMSEDDQLYEDLSKSAAAIREISTGLAAGEGTLGKLAKDDEVYNEVKLLLSEIRATVDDLRETAPITTFTSIFFGAF